MNLRLFLKPAAMAVIGIFGLSACTSGNLLVSKVEYQSVRTSFAQPEAIPDDARLVVQYFINPSGELMAVVYNMTDEILTIDQTKSFLVNTTGQSVSYYDPTIHSSTSGSFNAETSGVSFNLGAIASAFGVGGPLGSLMGGTSLSSSSTVGEFNSSTVTVQDQPLVRVGPHGKMVMSKQFRVFGIGSTSLNKNFIDFNRANSPLKFSTCISYAFENMTESDKLVTEFYVNSSIAQAVSSGKVSDAFREIYQRKPDALAEYSYIIKIDNNLPEEPEELLSGVFLYVADIYRNYVHGSLIDYK